MAPESDILLLVSELIMDASKTFEVIPDGAGRPF